MGSHLSCIVCHAIVDGYLKLNDKRSIAMNRLLAEFGSVSLETKGELPDFEEDTQSGKDPDFVVKID